ncbi:putative chitobiosyldiphosphodolichol beta-mannosyltransferase [Rosellinia necatrix]|uniref:Chitobiosyldiphosphodolichol beta-mannosyltransferase n=1 Tax=Rosellinia necatrix TaxID=77044 RepID=A0A1W2TL81_ROSNE|nr:putative chitobiosyldiphosphodolichol beta-mannosyltransferase [Rosellinia necatrix]
MSPLAIVLWSTFGGLFIATAAVLILLPSRYEKPSAATSGKASVSVQVLVLGDIGRSPRMQYHALSIARHGGTVDIVGYHESSPHPDLLASPNITIRALAAPPKILRTPSIPFLISGPLKVLWQVGTLFITLCYTTPASKWLLVQNPPSIPTLVVAMVVSILRNTYLMIDWHNYGWTILAGTKGATHPFVSLSRAYERALAQAAPTANVTVTHAMRRELQASPWDVQTPIVTLHDRPAAIFRPLASASERVAFLSALPATQAHAASILSGATRLVVSSTSWTPDEDFSLFLGALEIYAAATTTTTVPPPPNPPTRSHADLLVVITGKGPQKAHYEARIRALEDGGRLRGVRVVTAWLSVSEYAGLLRSADLGVCLHTSSSGVDLPMKVVDMFGSGLPVVAYSAYASFGELVREGVNGRGFETADELARLLSRLLSSSSSSSSSAGSGSGSGGGSSDNELAVLRKGAVAESELRWDEEWDRVLGRVFGFTE